MRPLRRTIVPDESGRGTRVFSWVVGLVMVLPVVVVVGLGLNGGMFLDFPPSRVSLHWLGDVASSSTWRSSFELSGVLAVGSSILTTALALCAALGVRESRHPRVWQTLFLLPLIVPAVVLVLALYPLYVQYGLIGTVPGLLFAHTLVAFPFAFLILWGAVHGLDPTLDRAAQSLGASPWRAAWRVTLPLLRPAIMAALVISAVVSFDELVLSLFLCSPQTVTVPVRLWSFVRQDLGPELGAASLLAMVVNLALMGVAMLFLRRGRQRSAAAAQPEVVVAR